jgi:hypothetical protein
MSRNCFVVALSLFLAAPAWGGELRLDAEETREFMKQLARYVFDNHLRRDAKSPQRGMIYEYFEPTKKGKLGQWIQGEALDTMHDGAWFVSALAQAYRATGEPFYLEFIEQWTLPFYLKMLNHSDELFSPERDDSDGRVKFDKEHMLQKGEKGFVPYWWDDGASVSLESARRKSGKASYPARDELAGQPNPTHRLSGYCLGCSNHMAQDLAVMLLAVWPLAKDKTGPLNNLRGEIQDAARNLYQSRLKHHGHIGVIDAMQALINSDAEAARHIATIKEWKPSNDYTRILIDFKPGQRYSLPGFTDNQEYIYWQWLVRTQGKGDPPSVMTTVYDAYTLPILFRLWSDNAPVPPGINRFDLASFFAKDGRIESYRSQRMGPTGSRTGPQNMIGCGRALQALDAFAGLWDERLRQNYPKDLRVPFLLSEQVKQAPDETLSDSASFGQVRVRAACQETALTLRGYFEGDAATIVLCSLPDGGGKRTTIALQKDGNSSAAEAEGKKLQLSVEVVNSEEGKHRFSVMLPHRAIATQMGGWNPIVHGRHSIKVGDQVRNFYVVPHEDRLKDSLLRELAGGLATWRGIFQEKGYIPTGMNAASVADTKWDNLSDSGGYAHLIAAAAQYLLYLDRQHDWEQKVSK